jgi:uncharacterized protein (TIGR03435 family)
MKHAAFAIGLLTAFSCFAQGPAATKLEFEVASVKLVDPPIGPHAVGLLLNHGLARLEGATLRQIIVQAYLVQRVRVLGGPGWYDIDQYDVTAKAENPDATRPQIQQMLQTLLADRFKLAVHRETRMQNHYQLIIGKDGSKLQEAKPEETTAFQQGNSGQLIFQRNPLATLVNYIANVLDTPVDDMTGLKGSYDYTLEWPLEPVAGNQPVDRLDLLMQDIAKLGLKLESHKLPTEVLIVDHAERPSPN